ncbi:MAG TPA: hypothetical protein VFO20_14750 [Propionibacteriaceae bacterium]|nr:hypothetical protein [Propionibacteriaceae bacterium]
MGGRARRVRSDDGPVLTTAASRSTFGERHLDHAVHAVWREPVDRSDRVGLVYRVIIAISTA